MVKGSMNMAGVVGGRPWIVIVEPDPDERLFVIVTVYEPR